MSWMDLFGAQMPPRGMGSGKFSDPPNKGLVPRVADPNVVPLTNWTPFQNTGNGSTWMQGPYPTSNSMQQTAPAQPTASDLMRMLMAQNRQREIADVNQQGAGMPPAYGMAPQRAQEAAYANTQPKNTQNIPTPPLRPDNYRPDVGSNGQGALYYLDPGDGGVIRPYFSKDGAAPNYPGMNVFKDESFDPSKATFMQKLMRGVPFA